MQKTPRNRPEPSFEAALNIEGITAENSTLLNYETRFWRDRVFTLACTGVALFAVLTLVAMFFYPGGTKADPTPRGHSFFANPFSTLGVLHTSSGESNYVSAALFIAAMPWRI